MSSDSSGHKEKIKMFSKRQIFNSFIILAFVLIIGNTFLETFSTDELVIDKLGATPHSAEIVVLDDYYKMYELVGEDLEVLMVYLSDLRLRKVLVSDSTSFSAKPIVGENYTLHVKTDPNDLGIYQAQTIHLHMGTNGKLYLRLHSEDTYRITEPNSLKGLYELLKNMDIQD